MEVPRGSKHPLSAALAILSIVRSRACVVGSIRRHVVPMWRTNGAGGGKSPRCVLCPRSIPSWRERVFSASQFLTLSPPSPSLLPFLPLTNERMLNLPAHRTRASDAFGRFPRAARAPRAPTSLPVDVMRGPRDRRPQQASKPPPCTPVPSFRPLPFSPTPSPSPPFYTSSDRPHPHPRSRSSIRLTLRPRAPRPSPPLGLASALAPERQLDPISQTPTPSFHLDASHTFSRATVSPHPSGFIPCLTPRVRPGHPPPPSPPLLMFARDRHPPHLARSRRRCKKLPNPWNLARPQWRAPRERRKNAITIHTLAQVQ
ncbi:hypothetical protein OF83DRAFT_615213 [Amylostereum chailletii]|nr:hypothetical protein OF83DRAFT_615213 [Amylostereum chailletii]